MDARRQDGDVEQTVGHGARSAGRTGKDLRHARPIPALGHSVPHEEHPRVDPRNPALLHLRRADLHLELRLYLHAQPDHRRVRVGHSTA